MGKAIDDALPSPFVLYRKSASFNVKAMRTPGRRVAFYCSPVGSTIYWPSEGVGLPPKVWHETSAEPDAVPPAFTSSPWAPGTTAARLAHPEPPSPSMVPPRLLSRDLLDDASPLSPRGMRIAVRTTDTPGESLAHYSPRTAAADATMPPLPRRLLHGRPDMDASGTDNGTVTPRTSKARVRRMAAQINRLPRLRPYVS